MSLDNRTVAMYGWKVEGRDNVDKFQKDLEDWKKDYWNDIENFIIEDTMSWEYIYFGLELVYYNADEGGSEVITKKLIHDKFKYWNAYMEGNPALNEIFNKYKNGEPQLYIFNHIW